ncbi:MAG: NAD-dependent epimerase/dehydratase family protein [Candidatus Cybelea sp.]
MTRALITGSQGFVGRYLVAALLASDPKIRILGVGRSQPCSTFTHRITLSSAPIPAPLPASLGRLSSDGRYEYVSGNIRDRTAMRAILREFRPDVIFHLASGLRDDAPHHLFGTSVEGTIGFLESVRDAALNLRALVIGSSGSVYGVPAHLPITEGDSCEPRDFYAVSKLAEEQVSRILARERGLPLIVGRIFNIVGPGQDERHVAGRFAAQLAAVAAGATTARVRVGDLSTTRDFIDVRDVAEALIVLARSGERGNVYNVASGVETAVSTVLEVLIREAGLHDTVEVESAYTRVSDTPRVVADITRLRAAGYQPEIPLEKSLADVLQYYGLTMALVPQAS